MTTISEEKRWDDVLARARGMTLQPQDLVEMMEFEALSFWRAGNPHKAEVVLDAAIDEASKNAEIMLARLHRSRSTLATTAASAGRGA